MKPHYLPPAPPSAGVVSPTTLVLGPLEAKVFGGIPILRCRTGTSLLTGVHFDAQPQGLCSTYVTIA